MTSSPQRPILYYMLESPPCRTVLAVARLLGIKIALKTVDISKKDQLKKEYLKLNPFHTVPTLVDTDGFTVWESRAICTYLVATHKPDSPLYPSTDVKARTTVDKLMQYDLGTFGRAITDVVYEIFNKGHINTDKLPRLEEVLKCLNDYLTAQSGPYVTGEQLTLADVSMYFNWSLVELAAPSLNQSAYPAIVEWNAEVKRALEPTNKDGKFTEAAQNLRTFAMMMADAAKKKS